jgi:hypothetical protein
LEDELIASQKKNEELSKIIADMEKTQNRLIEENNAILSVKVVNEVEIQTDHENNDSRAAKVPVTNMLDAKKEPALVMEAKKDHGQKLEESSRYATSVGVRIYIWLNIRKIVMWTEQQMINFL